MDTLERRQAAVAVIDELREVAHGPSLAPTPQQLDEIANGLYDAIHGPDAIARAARLPADTVLDIIAEYGMYLGQTEDDLSDVEVIDPSDPRARGLNQMSFFVVHSDDAVAVPDGFQADKCGREIGKSIRNVVAAGTDPVAQRRWLIRRHYGIRKPLTYPTVGVVHRAAQIGQLHKMRDLCISENRAGRVTTRPGVARLFVEAYDLLEVARIDAIAAVAEVLTGGVDEDRFRHLAVTFGWLHEGDTQRVLRTLSSEGTAPAVADLADRVDANPKAWRPEWIADMTDGQVSRIAERIGMPLDPASSKEEATVRNQINDSGLGADLDFLYPDLLAVTHSGYGHLVSPALERRANGDLHWADEINEIVAA